MVPWDSLSAEQQALFARYMEAYAAAVDNVDQNLRRLTDHLKALGEYENTIIVFTSDNGGTSEGGDTGTRSYFSRFSAPRSGLPRDWQPDVPRDPELIGGPRTFVHYPRGWAYASNTPFRMYKTFPHAGGVRVPMLLSWPAGLPRTADDDGVRHQFAHAVDIGPTLLQLAGVEPLAERHGLPARETDGVPFGNWLRNAAAASEHSTQYTELNGRRGYIAGTWKAIAPEPNGPGWKPGRLGTVRPGSRPHRTGRCGRRTPGEGARARGEVAGGCLVKRGYADQRRRLVQSQPAGHELLLEQPVTLYPGAPTLERYRSAKLVRLRSFTIDAQVEIADGDGGVLVAHGDQGGGYVLFLEDGELVLTYNEYGEVKRIGDPVQPGLHDIRVEFAALPDFKWAISLHVDGRQVAVLPEVFQLTGMAPFAGISVGLDRGGPVDWELSRRHGCYRYTGRLRQVRYTPGPKADYNPEQIVELDRAMAAAFE